MLRWRADKRRRRSCCFCRLFCCWARACEKRRPCVIAPLAKSTRISAPARRLHAEIARKIHHVCCFQETRCASEREREREMEGEGAAAPRKCGHHFWQQPNGHMDTEKTPLRGKQRRLIASTGNFRINKSSGNALIAATRYTRQLKVSKSLSTHNLELLLTFCSKSRRVTVRAVIFIALIRHGFFCCRDRNSNPLSPRQESA